MSLFPVLAASTPASSGGGAADSMMLIVMVAVLVIFYFVVFRKQNKQQKEHDALVAGVESGDSILTSSGFYGVVLDVMEDIVIVEFGSNKNCRIPMKKEAIIEVEKPKEAENK